MSNEKEVYEPRFNGLDKEVTDALEFSRATKFNQFRQPRKMARKVREALMSECFIDETDGAE